MIRFAFGLLLFIHAFAHLVGFVVPWRIATLDEMPYRTTVLGGSVELGDLGIRVVGIIWLGIALAFAACSIGVFTRQSWAWPLAAWTTPISLAMCVIGWPDARIGVFVNAAIVGVLLVAPNDTSRSVEATRDEQTRSLPGDDLLAGPKLSMTHAITIRRPPHDVWPWIAQMGAGSRAGWYSYDFLDNRHHQSAKQIVSELQHLNVGMVFPALPGKTDGFTLVAFEPRHFLILDFKAADGTRLVTWAFVLESLNDGSTRLIVRARGTSGAVGNCLFPVVHYIMERKQLLGISSRAETMSRPAVAW